MEQRKVTATEFKNRVGQYLDDAGREPVYITRHDRPLRVLVDIQEYERLKEADHKKGGDDMEDLNQFMDDFLEVHHEVMEQLK